MTCYNSSISIYSIFCLSILLLFKSIFLYNNNNSYLLLLATLILDFFLQWNITLAVFLMLFYLVFYYSYSYLLKPYWCIITTFWPNCAPRQTSTVNLEFLDYNHNIYLEKLYFNIFFPAPLYVFMKQTSCLSWLDEVLECVCFLHPSPKPMTIFSCSGRHSFGL